MRIFSRIRHALTGSTSGRYFRYAIGEVVLIVLGIMIALQLDNWNEYRKELAKEELLLGQLRKEFQSELDELDDKISIRLKMIASAERLLQYVDTYEAGVEIDLDSLTAHINRTTFAPTFNSNTKDFVVSRDMGLIRNDSLRILLAKWPNLVEQTTEEEISFYEYRSQYYLPFLIEYFQTRNMFSMLVEDQEMFGRIYFDSTTAKKVEIGRSKKVEDIAKLLENGDFEDHLAFVIFVNNLANTQSLFLKETIQKILYLIEE